MFNDLYGNQTDQALAAKAKTAKPEVHEVSIMQGVGGALWRGPAAGALETGRALNYLGSISTAGMAAKALSPKPPTSIDGWFAENETGKTLGKEAKALEPDPEASGAAAQIVHGLTKFGAKAVGYAATMGPLAPFAFGADEGISEGLKLTDQGVDGVTAAQAGVVHGIMSGVGVALPMTAKTLKGTAALIGVGGPGFFMGEQHVMRTVLEDADYLDLSKMYDPFDVTGMVASVAAPTVFAGAAKIAQGAKAKQLVGDTPKRDSVGTPKRDSADPDPIASALAEAEPVPPREAVDAVRVKQLSEHESFKPPEPTNAKAAAEFTARIKDATDRLNAGEKIELETPSSRPVTKVELTPGKFRPMRDSDGAPVAASPEEAASLYKWMGDSKLVTDDGAPVVMFKTADESGQVVVRDSLPAPRETKGQIPDTKAPDSDKKPGSADTIAQKSETPEAEPEAPPTPVYVKAERIAATKEQPLPEGSPVPKGSDAAWVDTPEGPGLKVAKTDQTRAAPRDTPGADLDQAANARPSPPDQQARPDAELVQPETPVKPTDQAETDEFDAQTDQVAQTLIDELPDLEIELDDGTRISAAEAMQMADEVVAQANTDAKAFEAAVQCFLRT